MKKRGDHKNLNYRLKDAKRPIHRWRLTEQQLQRLIENVRRKQ